MVLTAEAESDLSGVSAVVFFVLDTDTANFADPSAVVRKVKISDAERFEECTDALIGFLCVITVKYEIEPQLAVVSRNIERDLKALVTGAECFFNNVVDPYAVITGRNRGIIVCYVFARVKCPSCHNKNLLLYMIIDFGVPRKYPLACSSCGGKADPYPSWRDCHPR